MMEVEINVELYAYGSQYLNKIIEGNRMKIKLASVSVLASCSFLAGQNYTEGAAVTTLDQ